MDHVRSEFDIYCDGGEGGLQSWEGASFYDCVRETPVLCIARRSLLIIYLVYLLVIGDL